MVRPLSMGVCRQAPAVTMRWSVAASRRRCQVLSIQREMGIAGELMEGSVAQILHRVLPEGGLHAALQESWNWVDANIIDLGRQMRVSYLPPLMVYMAAGISGLTAIVGTFFVKDYLGLSAEFLAMLGFWAGIPWALKMPLGHVVDLAWRWKSLLVFLGAALIAASLGIMLGLLSAPSSMARYMSVEAWFVLSALLSPFGYVIQDVVADAMTVEAVPVVDDSGQPYDEQTLKLMHTTMQTLGRVAIIGGGIAVSLVNILMFRGTGAMTEATRAAVYIDIYKLAMLIPAISVLGVVFAAILKWVRLRRLRREGVPADE